MPQKPDFPIEDPVTALPQSAQPPYHQGVMEFSPDNRSNEDGMATPLISVVDDDHSVRESLARLIRSVGFGVQVFGSAEEFLSVDQGREPDCLILDIRMPGMNGLELQRELSASRRDLPGIFITAPGSDEEVRARALRAGAVDYLLKPLQEEEVLKAIDAALSSK
jgi:FixJ family two-component response regulator